MAQWSEPGGQHQGGSNCFSSCAHIVPPQTSVPGQNSPEIKLAGSKSSFHSRSIVKMGASSANLGGGGVLCPRANKDIAVFIGIVSVQCCKLSTEVTSFEIFNY